MSNKTKVSVVTVCYNAEKTIKKTMNSVLKQTYTNYEYIIVDGASTDNTYGIISKIKDNRILCISEPDKGIYDAMNKAIQMANGEYTIFMNSGDFFANRYVLEKMIPFLNSEIVYGNIIRDYLGKRVVVKYRNNSVWRLLYFIKSEMICHQAIFAKTELLRRYPYNLKYKICADRDFIVRCIKENRSFNYIDINIAKVDCVEGVSSNIKNKDLIRKETDDILKNYYPIIFSFTIGFKEAVRFIHRRNEREKMKY